MTDSTPPGVLALADHQQDTRLPYTYQTGEGHAAVFFCLAELARVPSVFYRGRELVTIANAGTEKEDKTVERDAEAPVIAPLAHTRIWELLSARIRWERYDTRAGKMIQRDPPPPVVSALHTRGDYPGVRRLKGIVSHPVLRPDGSLHDTPGYDRATALYYVAGENPPVVPDEPTHDDGIAAVDELLDVVADFPFAAPRDRAAWLSGLLAPIAWPAFDGGAPLFLFDANTPGTGKSLACDVIGEIVTGCRMPRTPYVEDNDELRKRITSHAMNADTLALIDNAPGGSSIGWPALDSALTGDVWTDRILGRSENVRLPLNLCWYVTGNNLAVRHDAARRTLRIRLEADSERPEERSGFVHDPLLPWVRSERSRLQVAVLTVLRAYIVAGMPDVGIRPLGSFEGWSTLVRASLVWCGQPDVVDCLVAKDCDADPEALTHRRLLAGWRELVEAVRPTAGGLTVKQALESIGEQPGQFADLQDAIGELCPTRDGSLPTSRRLGYKLRAIRGRWREVDGQSLALTTAGKTHRTVVWSVTSRGVDGGDGGHQTSAHQPGLFEKGGDDGHRGDVPPSFAREPCQFSEPGGQDAPYARHHPPGRNPEILGSETPQTPPEPPPLDEPDTEEII